MEGEVIVFYGKGEYSMVAGIVVPAALYGCKSWGRKCKREEEDGYMDNEMHEDNMVESRLILSGITL